MTVIAQVKKAAPPAEKAPVVEPAAKAPAAPVVSAPSSAAAPTGDADKKKTSFDVGLNTDPFFGFNVLAGGAYPLSDSIDLNVYGLYWTNVGAGINNNPWTEFGGGATFKPMGDLSISLLVGVLNGDLQSQNGVANVGEAIVPNITVNYSSDLIEGQWYTAYYKTMSAGAVHRNAVDDYLHGWINAGVRVTPGISVGVHYEHLETLARYPQGTTSAAPRGSYSAMIYRWIGGYFETKFPDNNIRLRYTGGIDTVKGREHFYKLGLVISF